jgi:hypothetical protein
MGSREGILGNDRLRAMSELWLRHLNGDIYLTEDQVLLRKK